MFVVRNTDVTQVPHEESLSSGSSAPGKGYYVIKLWNPPFHSSQEYIIGFSDFSIQSFHFLSNLLGCKFLYFTQMRNLTRFLAIFYTVHIICLCIYRVFINEWNRASAYHFGQISSYDLGHVGTISYIDEYRWKYQGKSH